MTTALVTRTGTIYLLTSPSGKQYVGQTQRPVSERFAAHARGSSTCRVLLRAIKKYGAPAFRVESVMVGVPAEALNFWEGFCVAFFRTLSPLGYNLGPGGNAHIRTSDETRRRMGISGRAASARPETRARRSAAQLKSNARPGVKEKRSASMRRTLANPEKRVRMAEATRVSFEDPERRAKHAAAVKVSQTYPGVQEHKAEAMRRTLASPVKRQQMAEAMRESWEKPGVRETWVRHMQESSRTSEGRQKKAEAIRKYLDESEPAEQRAARLANLLHSNARRHREALARKQEAA